MTEAFAGFELPEGATIDSLEQWPSFAEWWERAYGCIPMPDNPYCKEIFTAYVQGAHWQWHKSAFEDVEICPHCHRRADFRRLPSYSPVG